MLFLRRDGQYLAPKQTFRQLMKEGSARYGDWVDHLSTLFPEVRIKKVLEIRSADCVDPAMTGGLAALMRGLLYDPTALAELEPGQVEVGFTPEQCRRFTAKVGLPRS